MSESKILDWLAETALLALESSSPHLQESWFADQRYKLTGRSRLEVLGWIVFDLDDNGISTVASALGISLEDLDAVRRVLKKI